jgi:hypothetical protein
MGPDQADLWRLLPIGYLLTIALETPVLLIGLSPCHTISRRLVAGVWLTACTYPIVILVLPFLIWQPLGDVGYWPYVIAAEIFAPAAECGLFWLAFWKGRTCDISSTSRRFALLRDFGAIVLANLVSFLVGGWLLNRLTI